MSTSMSPAIRIRHGVVGDAPALADFGARIFTETFGPDNRPEDMAAYLAQAYGESQQRTELAKEGNTFFIVESEGRIAGYAFLRPAASPIRHTGEGMEVEVARFYVDRSLHGSGAARELMERVVSEARGRGATALWLGVFERNPRAIRFYEKCGFRDVGGQLFTLGTDVQRDRVMRLDLGTRREGKESHG